MSRAAASRGRNGGGKRTKRGWIRVTVQDDGTVDMHNAYVVGMSGLCRTVDEAIECLNDRPGWGFTIVNDDEIIDAINAFVESNKPADLYFPTEEEYEYELEEIPGMAELEHAI